MQHKENKQRSFPNDLHWLFKPIPTNHLAGHSFVSSDTGRYVTSRFEGNMDAFAQLQRNHPTQSIGQPEEIGKLAVMIAGNELPSLNGSTIQLNGGIGSC